MDKKTLVSKQIFIVLYLLAAAISCIEATAQYRTNGIGNWRFWFFTGIFLFAAFMYFLRKKQRFEEKTKS